MDFYAVLDKVIDLLRSRGRVTYGALKLQFGLNNEQLEVLKDEIISAQRLARDEDGRVLVWIGEPTKQTPELLSTCSVNPTGSFTAALLRAHHYRQLHLTHQKPNVAN